MLIDAMDLLNNPSKIYHKIANFIGIKTVLHISLAIFWALIIFGTIKELV
jgi:hypothetical protein|tara:strand:- start:219 stop:368 length:150 start_codon:yes stop_codon:yes gene_type:complete